MHDDITDNLVVDRDEIETFFDALFRHADSGYVQMRAMHNDGEGEPFWPFTFALADNREKVIDEAIKKAQACADASRPVVFCPPVCTFHVPTKGREEDVRLGLTLSVECDTTPDDARWALEEVLGEATVAVASGGTWTDSMTTEVQDKLHLHWRLAQPTRTAEEHMKLKTVRRMAAKFVKSDTTNNPICHPIKWPGSWNKKNAPRLARIVSLTENEIDLDRAYSILKELAPDIVDERERETNGTLLANTIDDLRFVVGLIPNGPYANDEESWENWSNIGLATFTASGGSDEGFEVFDQWSRRCVTKDHYKEQNTRKKWKNMKHSPPDRIGMGTLVHLAREAFPDLTLPSWGTPDETSRTWAEDMFNMAGDETEPEWSTSREERPRSCPGLWIDDDDWIEADIPKRPWVVPRHAMRGAVTVLTGPPSVAKSSLMLAWACAAALGVEHGKFVPASPATVLVYNVEDDKDEQRRRLSAVLRQFESKPSEIRGKVIRTGPGHVGTLFHYDEKKREIKMTPAMVRLRELIAERKPDILIADPLAELHDCDENDNSTIRDVIAHFRAVAQEFDMSVILIHHTRKGLLTAGDPDNARGASAIVGAARIVLTLSNMTEKDASDLMIDNDRKTRSDFIRLDDAKQNYAAIEDANWYKKVLYCLENGEYMPAVEPWTPKDIADSITEKEKKAILDMIQEAVGNGQPYSDAPNAGKRAVAKAINERFPDISEFHARRLIKGWLEDETLYKSDYRDKKEGRDRKGLYVSGTIPF